MKIIQKTVVTALLFVVEISLSQTVIWEKKQGGNHAEFLYDAIATPDYGYILAGSSLSEDTGDKLETTAGDLDFWIWKMNESGNLEWQKRYGGTASDHLISMQLTPDGGYILAGTSDSPIKEENSSFSDKTEPLFGLDDFWIIKLNAFGKIEWQKSIGGKGQEKLAQVILTGDGNYLAVGSSNSGKTGNKTGQNYGALDYWIVKISKKGEIIWQKSYGGIYNDELKVVTQTLDGGFLMGGISNSPASETKKSSVTAENTHTWFIKTDASGNEQWQLTKESINQNIFLSSLLVLPNGNYLVGGNTVTSLAEKGRDDLWISELNSDGSILWEKTYIFKDVNKLSTIVKGKENTYIVGAHATSTASGFLTFSIDYEGNRLWETHHASTKTDVLKKVIETRDGSYLLAGTRRDEFSSDFYVLKQVDNQKQIQKIIDLEALPNPTDAYTNIVIGDTYTNGTLTVYDLVGKQLQRIELTGLRTIPVNLSTYLSGIYLIEIKTNKQHTSIKVIKK